MLELVAEQLATALDPVRLMRAAGMDADDWQGDVLRSTSDRILLNCSRQSGKSETTSILALHTGLYIPDSLVLLLSQAERQSLELLTKVKRAFKAIDYTEACTVDTTTELGFSNGSRIISLPANSETIRGYSGVRLLVVDEASRTPDSMFIAVNPMLAVSHGRMIAMSTPRGKRGWFWDQWAHQTHWQKFEIPATRCPRITPEFLAEQRKTLGERWFRQEYMCSFEENIGQVFSTEAVEAAFVDDLEPMLFLEAA